MSPISDKTAPGGTPAGSTPSATRVGIVCVVGLLGAVMLVGLGSRATSSTPLARARRVLVISAPGLTWADVRRVHPPSLDRVFGSAALASLSVRTVGPGTDPGSAYLTLGAGLRAATPAPPGGLALLAAHGTAVSGPAGAASRGSTTTARIPPEAVRQALSVNRAGPDRYGAVPGLLAATLHAHHRSVGVLADAQTNAHPLGGRDAAWFAANRSGVVNHAELDRSLVRPEPGAPGATRLDPVAVGAAFGRLWGRCDVVLVELSDLARARGATTGAVRSATERRRYDDALRWDDAIVGRILGAADPGRDRVLVVAPTSPGSRQELTVFAAGGTGTGPGWASSATTRRAGYVTLADVAPTVLGDLGVKVPSAMGQTPISTARDSATLTSRVDSLASIDSAAVNRDRAFVAFTAIFVILVIVGSFFAALAARGRRPARIPALLAAYTALIVPTVCFLAGPTGLYRWAPVAGAATLLGVAAAGAAVATAMTRRWRAVDVAAALVAMLWCVLAVDVATGAHLQIATMFGYSPIIAGRFAGFGNTAFSMFSCATVILIGAAADRVRRMADDQPADPWFVAAAAVVLVWAVLLDGLAGFGSSFSAANAFAPTAVVVVAMVAGRRLRPLTVVGAAAATVAMSVVFAVVDLSRPAAQQTHFARFVTALMRGDFTTTLERKLHANLASFANPWTWFIPPIMAIAAYKLWTRSPGIVRLEAAHRGFRMIAVCTLVLGVLSALLNDSGIGMPATMVAISFSYVIAIAVDLPDPAAGSGPGTTGRTTEGAPGDDLVGSTATGH